MAKLYNLARMTTATVGTGTITLGSAASGYLTFALAGVADGDCVSYGIADGSNSEVGIGKYTSSGTTLSRSVTKSTNSNSAISLSGTAQVFIIARADDLPILQNYLSGLTLTRPSTTTFTAAIGMAADSTNAVMLSLSSAFTKSTSAWASGTGNGGLDTSTIANSTWYHVYLIGRSDTGAVDMLFSTSASAPTMPSNYDLKRRIGSLLTDGSAHFIDFSQNGDEFLWLTPLTDINVANLGTTATLYTLTVPLGVKVNALMRMNGTNATPGTAILFNSPDETSTAAASPNGNYNILVFQANVANTAALSIRTNTSSQVRGVANVASTTIQEATYGWVDRRGRDG